MTEMAIGEIIGAGTTAFVAQCLEDPHPDPPKLFDPPPLGSFVKVVRGPFAPVETGGFEEPDPFLPAEERDAASAALYPAVYALVFDAQTSSLDPGRRPAALGYADEDELRRLHPQIFELLRTEFHALLVAHSEGGDAPLKRHLPPRPPRIHSRVYACGPHELRALTTDLSFLRGILIPAGGPLVGAPVDEVAAACIRQAAGVYENSDAFLLKTGREIARILTADYDRLRALLRNISG